MTQYEGSAKVETIPRRRDDEPTLSTTISVEPSLLELQERAFRHRMNQGQVNSFHVNFQFQDTSEVSRRNIDHNALIAIIHSAFEIMGEPDDDDDLMATGSEGFMSQ